MEVVPAEEHAVDWISSWIMYVSASQIEWFARNQQALYRNLWSLVLNLSQCLCIHGFSSQVPYGHLGNRLTCLIFPDGVHRWSCLRLSLYAVCVHDWQWVWNSALPWSEVLRYCSARLHGTNVRLLRVEIGVYTSARSEVVNENVSSHLYVEEGITIWRLTNLCKVPQCLKK
jgi:hypothetical protein